MIFLKSKGPIIFSDNAAIKFHNGLPSEYDDGENHRNFMPDETPKKSKKFPYREATVLRKEFKEAFF